MTIRLTAHAIQRYRERIANLPLAEIVRALDTRAVNTAIDFGARYVRLGTGHRVVLAGDVVITILPPGLPSMEKVDAARVCRSCSAVRQTACRYSRCPLARGRAA